MKSKHRARQVPKTSANPATAATGNPAAAAGLALDFQDTARAFVDKTDTALRKAVWLFRLMNSPLLVQAGAAAGMVASRLRISLIDKLIRDTIFEQFCGGTTLLGSSDTILRLHRHGVQTVLDYGAEGKTSESDFNFTMNENIRAIEFSSQIKGISTISTKVTGLARFDLLEKVSNGELMSQQEKDEFHNVVKRLDHICHSARNAGVRLFIDAEESWIQPAIDKLANHMMKRYNRGQVVVYNTFQLYRTDRLAFLMESHDKARAGGYWLGAKLVRGAYMDKERDRAQAMGYPSPIQPTKTATDEDFNLALRFCVDNHRHIACCNASHNAESNYLLASLVQRKGIPRDHPHILFSQLYGMSDNITFNLAAAGFNASKYVVYGQVHEVIPYLIRRTRENTSVTGDLSRELQLLLTEVRRRGL